MEVPQKFKNRSSLSSNSLNTRQVSKEAGICMLKGKPSIIAAALCAISKKCKVILFNNKKIKYYILSRHGAS